MEEKENKKPIFKAIPVNGSTTYSNSKSGFGKTVIVPFISGVLGCSVVIGTCFGVPSIRTKLIGNSNSSISSSNNNSTRIKWIC